MIEVVAAFSVSIAVLASVCVVLATALRSSVASHRSLCERQADQLMLFHRAGQSMAEHEIRMAEMATREREAQAKIEEARALEARAQRELSHMAERNGRFSGVPKVISEV